MSSTRTKSLASGEGAASSSRSTSAARKARRGLFLSDEVAGFERVVVDDLLLHRERA
ncbi:hypothetical protein IRY31_04910 [Corynebacterium afermentans subsp. lipophilum]|uniref:hypothetical protein n=1 Tax=Corynebacterium afermentans TaxID=38286 RepID=UPI00188ADC06|nr:hypothetical protein [Corynebacterium afermentans]MBF4547412.1 hypothetical protein [Corynebacterium afermentans subsp. lipophilum]